MPDPARWRAICFDLDGVLIDTMPLHARAWQDALATFGLRVSRRDIYEWEGESGVVTARTLLSRRGREPSGAEIRALLAAKERRFSRLARGVRVPAALRACLAVLARRGLRLALVTGTSSREVRRVVPGSLRRLFQVIITGDRVRRGKPHPEPYRSALKRLCIPPADAIVVENAPYGIRSARAARAGLVVALASSLPRRYLRGAHVIVSSVSALRRFLERTAVVDKARHRRLQYETTLPHRPRRRHIA
jgi:beta-phosphoglucomutase